MTSNVPPPLALPYGSMVGPDGALWFTETGSQRSAGLTQ